LLNVIDFDPRDTDEMVCFCKPSYSDQLEVDQIILEIIGRFLQQNVEGSIRTMINC
jgi:hypothetical protein